MIDAGHGGDSNSGCILAVGYGSLTEAEYVLGVARQWQRIIPQAILTREYDQALTFAERNRLAQANKASLVISLHVDSRPGALRGLACWHLPSDSAMMTLARRIYDLAPAQLKPPRGPGRARPVVAAIDEGHLPADQRWRHKGRHVLTSFSAPTLLLEIGDAKGDIEALMDRNVQCDLGNAVRISLKEEGWLK